MASMLTLLKVLRPLIGCCTLGDVRQHYFVHRFLLLLVN